MPNFGIVDTHLHIWDPEKFRYEWLDDIPILNKSYLIEDYQRSTAGLMIDKMVFLQCEVASDQYLAEARWVSEVAREDPRIEGIVAWAPLEKGAAAVEDLDKLIDIPQVKGVRRIIQFEPNAEFCLKPSFVEGVKLLENYSLSFDICIKGSDQFANSIELVRSCPNVHFILDHIGKPDIIDGSIHPWKSQICELAEFSNTTCKISGMVVEANMESWSREELEPYLDTVLDAFGPDRLVFGGDWPVVVQAAEYREWVAAFDWYLSGTSESEQRKIYRDNAVRVYRLDP
ncbi:MAG: amidohydrolase [Trueperaceae bacterium]|mgnify:CR=1 FL=1|nr:amidohydrolase [Trueperaceae bacterium]